MAVLTVDIAFDWDSNPKGGYDGFCLVGPSGFDLALAGSQIPAGVRGVGISDQLQFQIYDISDTAASRTLGDLQIAFQAAHAANATQHPFAASAVGSPVDGWFPLANLQLGSVMPNGRSGVYGGPFDTWQVSPRPLALTHAGWYFFRVSFTATTGGASKTFGNDPEMIVRPSG
jgi:hypothetical protein